MLRVAASVLAGLLLVAPVFAEQELESEARGFREMFEDLMERRVDELESGGSRLVPIQEDLWVGRLDASRDDEGERATREFRFSGGRGQYVVMGLCDEDCGDIDLHLWDTGKVRGESPRLSDIEPDAEPLLISGVLGDDLVDGDYEIEIQMFECRAEYCYFAVGLYRLVE